MKPCTLFLVISLLILAACGVQPPPVTPAPSAALSTVPSATATPAPSSSLTPLPPTPTATPAPIQGTLTIKVNVRSGPGTAFAALGLLDAGEKVQVLVRDATGAWYQIVYPAAPGGTGWVAAQFVQLAAGAQVPLDATPTPTGPSGRVLQRLNVRSGPGLSFNSLGTLEPDVTVALTGKNATASWFQIDYPSGPGGHGWVTAQYVQTDASSLPVLDQFGTPVAGNASGPTPLPVTATPTIGPAFDDQDSAAHPAVNVTFSTGGTRRFTYSGQVSAPGGDPEDWVEFSPFAVSGSAARLVLSLACSGNGTLTVELQQGGSLLSGWGSLACGDQDKLISLPAGQAVELRLAPAPGQGLRLVNYVLTVENLP